MAKRQEKHPDLDIRVSAPEEGTCVVECAGEVDIHNAPRFRQALESRLSRATRGLVLDLRRVTFIDSVGIGVLVAVKKHLGAGARFQVWATDQRVRTLLAMAGLGKAIASAEAIRRLAGLH